MAVTGTNSENQNMRFLAQELLVNGVPITPSAINITALTNNSGGTANDTVEVVPAATAASTDTSAASLASTNAALTAIKNDIADLTVKLNEVITAINAQS